MNLFKRIVALLLACAVLYTLFGCAAGLNGTYKSKDGLIEQTVTFSDGNRISVSAFGVEIEGDYVIKDGKLVITYTVLGLRTEWEKKFEKKGYSIFIDGTEFIKE